ncbi:hypothetical protein LV716_18060 [Flagellimonas sp. HMM57]|uniref:hypothetical protein n=1 Tax=unclassified Flagellimonas TaxID=2644544 RepID=UPI0013D68384|nr:MULTISPECIES: hypothetical protein [unclassified Flagellimonas]UII76147.1 hypothetical protein LV716_18060 [Flagellimonas sp. HMM57]
MNNNDLQVVSVTKKELRFYLETKAEERDYLLPLSENKAQWILEKPGMDEEDVCIVFAHSKGEVLSFAYLLPDVLSSTNTETDRSNRKVFWMPQWWASTAAKGTVISTYIFNEALRITNQRVLTKAYEQNADTFYKKQPFSIIQTMQRHTIFIALDHKMIIQRIPILRYIKFFFKWLEKASRTIYYWLNRSRIKGITKNIKIKYINQLDTDAWNFVKPFLENDLIAKDKDYVNWQIANKQYIPVPWSSKKSNTGIVKGFGKKIGIVNYILQEEKNIVAFISFNYISDVAYMKYCVTSEENMTKVSASIYENMIRLKLNYLFTDNVVLADSFSENLSVVYQYTQTKKSMSHNAIHPMLKGMDLAEQDGHFI